ncbi:MAG: transposase family protein, partial [Providencia heimbachae]|nr:transposase family protein [Providencia heimbachae]
PTTDSVEYVWDRDKILDEQRKDPEIIEIVKNMETNQNDKYFKDDDGLIYKKAGDTERHHKVVVPKAMVSKILYHYHNLPLAGHTGYLKTLHRIKRQLSWKGMTKDVKRYCEECLGCQRTKTSSHLRPAPLELFERVNKPFARCAMDIVGPLPNTDSGNKYILTFQDHFSKYLEAFPIKDQTAETTAEVFVTKIICRHGTPEALLTDQGRNFISECFKNVCKLLNVKKIQTSAYHAMGNGLIERSHRVIKEYLQQYVNDKHSDWDKLLPFAVLAFNTTIRASIMETPSFLVYGRDIDLPFDDILTPRRARYDLDDNYGEQVVLRLQRAFALAESKIHEAEVKYQTQYNKKTKPVQIKVGDLVLLRQMAVKLGLSTKLSR